MTRPTLSLAALMLLAAPLAALAAGQHGQGAAAEAAAGHGDEEHRPEEHRPEEHGPEEHGYGEHGEHDAAEHGLDDHGRAGDGHDGEHAGDGHDGEHAGAGGAGDEHVAVAGFGLRATHPWTNATDRREALVFVALENHGAAPLSLTGARSPVAAGAMLVGFRLENGAPRYAPLGTMTLDAEGAVTLAPFGLAIRLTGLAEPLHEGESLPVTLLTDRGALEMVVAVEATGATQHSHAGHAHD